MMGAGGQRFGGGGPAPGAGERLLAPLTSFLGTKTARAQLAAFPRPLAPDPRPGGLRCTS